MTHAIIKGLWGDYRLKRWSKETGWVGGFPSVLESVKASLQRGDSVDRVYCFGTENEAFLKSLGYDPVLIDDNPWPMPRRKRIRQSSRQDQTLWGTCYWWCKVRILQEASKDFEHVLWTDFDVRQVKPIPSDFWDRLARGPSYRAPLYVRVHYWIAAWWRIPPELRVIKKAREWKMEGTKPVHCSNPKLAAKLGPGGGWIYVRNQSADCIMAAYQDCLRNNDQTAAALALDRWYGGWIGVDRYNEVGHNSVGFWCRQSLDNPSPKNTIWETGEIREKKLNREDYVDAVEPSTVVAAKITPVAFGD